MGIINKKIVKMKIMDNQMIIYKNLRNEFNIKKKKKRK